MGEELDGYNLVITPRVQKIRQIVENIAYYLIYN